MGANETLIALIILQALIKWLEAKNEAGADHPEDNDLIKSILEGLLGIFAKK